MPPIRLINLKPQFIRYETRQDEWERIVGPAETWRERGCPSEKVTGPREYKIFVPDLAKAQGIHFVCPKCLFDNGGSIIGVHHCEVTFEGCGVLDHQGTHNESGQPVRWRVSGSTFDDLTTHPSILLIGGCNWHGWIQNGNVHD